MERKFLVTLALVTIGLFFSGIQAQALPTYDVYYSGIAYPSLLPTNQTAQATFTLTDADTLTILLRETTGNGASSLTGAGAILTSIGFLLPGDVTLVATGSNVVIGPGSESVGFITSGSPTDYPSGTNVSGEWGVTVGGEKPIGNGDVYDFASVITAQVTPLSGSNRDDPLQLDGPQAGLLQDSAARGGLGVIDNGVILTLNLSGEITEEQFAALGATSVVEWGSDAAFSRVPEPSTMMLLGFGLIGLVGFGRKKFIKR